MGAIISGIESIIDFFGTLINLVVSFVEGSFALLRSVPSAISALTSAIGYLPATLSVFAVGGILVSVVFLIVGRSKTNG